MIDTVNQNSGSVQHRLSLDDVGGILNDLFLENNQEESPAQREFSVFLQNWCRRQVMTTQYRELIHKTRSDVHILSLAADQDDRTELRGIVAEQVQNMRNDMRQHLVRDILGIYRGMSPAEREVVDDLLGNPHLSKSISLGIMLLLQHIETTNDKKSEWIRRALGHVHSMSESVKSIRSRTKGPASHKELIFGQFMDMYQETLVAISAIACHMYAEDCSVILQPVKIKHSGSTDADIGRSITAIEEFVSSRQDELSGGYFPGLSGFLGNPDNRSKLQRGKYVYIPLIVDAKDLLLYLRIMEDFFVSWKRYLEGKKQNKFRILKNTLTEASQKGVQPRIKFQYQAGKGAGDFNIRIDYVRGKLEMDIGGVDYRLQGGGDLMDYLIRQDRPVIANSYNLGVNRDTSRIATDAGLTLEERMALIHSAMMEQGGDILGRDESRIFGYHFVLKESVSEREFSEIQAMF